MDKTIRARISLRNPWHFLALGFGSGLSPIIPGTMGTLVGMPLVLLLSLYIPTLLYVGVTVLACVVGVLICQKTADSMQVHDHGSIVWDEIAGILITFLLVPLSVKTALFGFVLFRLLDMLKPWPISYFDKHIHGGAGIMLDDIIAGGVACVSLHLALMFKLF